MASTINATPSTAQRTHQYFPRGLVRRLPSLAELTVASWATYFRVAVQGVFAADHRGMSTRPVRLAPCRPTTMPLNL